MQICHGRRRCALSADTGTFGNPCRTESRMYLKTVYTCGKYDKWHRRERRMARGGLRADGDAEWHSNMVPTMHEEEHAPHTQYCFIKVVLTASANERRSAADPNGACKFVTLRQKIAYNIKCM